MIVYHLTSKRNLSSILKNGLIPKIGPRSKFIGENKKRIYFFKDIDDIKKCYKNEHWIPSIGKQIVILKTKINKKYIEDKPSCYEIEVAYTKNINSKSIEIFSLDLKHLLKINNK